MNEMDHKCALVISDEDSKFYDWSPSTDANDTKDLIEWAGDEGYHMMMNYFNGLYHVTFYPEDMNFVEEEDYVASQNMEMAITLAFLGTFYGEDEEN